MRSRFKKVYSVVRWRIGTRVRKWVRRIKINIKTRYIKTYGRKTFIRILKSYFIGHIW